MRRNLVPWIWNRDSRILLGGFFLANFLIVYIWWPLAEEALAYALLTLLAGSGLGYFLELWGTTRQCWTYYTYQAPPLFAVLAHGMAAVVFWRAGLVINYLYAGLSFQRSRWRDPAE